MTIKNIVLILFASIFLQACASPKMGEEYEAGKMKFNAGNYRDSFHDLLPVAVCGNMQAQYAVGYMYYYGIGTAQDSESGLFWMKRSADQHYPPAANALGLILGDKKKAEQQSTSGIL
jgi:TPR repeat protein